MKKRTGMRIEAERVLTKEGQPGRKLLKFTGLASGQLPAEYESAMPSVTFSERSISLYGYTKEGYQNLRGGYDIGNVVTKAHFQELLRFLYDAGEHLQKVNAARREIKKTWHGKETFVI